MKKGTSGELGGEREQGQVLLMTMNFDVAKMLLSAKLKTYPRVYLPLARLREGEKKRLVRPTTDIVIEGTWRCGNHFATYAFMSAQPRPVDVAHHFHAPAQLMLAAKWGVPAVLLIRDPVEAVASTTVYVEKEDPRGLLTFYNIFHRAVLPIADRVVVSDFPRTVGNFGSVIAEVNRRYGRSFAPFHDTLDENERVEEMIRREHAENMRANAATLPFPSAEKAKRKERVLERMRAPRCSPLVDEAERLYNALKLFELQDQSVRPVATP